MPKSYSRLDGMMVQFICVDTLSRSHSKHASVVRSNGLDIRIPEGNLRATRAFVLMTWTFFSICQELSTGSRRTTSLNGLLWLHGIPTCGIAQLGVPLLRTLLV